MIQVREVKKVKDVKRSDISWQWFKCALSISLDLMNFCFVSDLGLTSHPPTHNTTSDNVCIFSYASTGRLWKKCVYLKSAPNHRLMCPKVISSQKVVKMRHIGTFCVESFAREALGQVLDPFFGQRISFFKHYSHIPSFSGLLLTFPTFKCRTHTPSYLWVTQKCCLFGVRAWWWNFLWMMSPKIGY